MPRSEWWPFARSVKSPLEGMTPEAQYEAIRWGIKPKRLSPVDVPGMKRGEEVVLLGTLRVLYLDPEDGREEAFPWPVSRGTRLCVGADSNRLWIVPPRSGLDLRALRGMPAKGVLVVRTDYTAVKGDEDAYWYHDHEPPFPRLKRVPGGVQFSRGRYVVAPEGIVG